MIPAFTTVQYRTNGEESWSGIRHDLERAFDEAFGPMLAATHKGHWQMPVAISESDTDLQIEMDLPGVTREDVEITFEDGRLSVRGERKPSHSNRKKWRDERVLGRFERVFNLSDSVDPSAIQADLTEGVLVLTIPKKQEARPVRIAIHGKEDSCKRLTTD